jgi:hypothetical protein
VIAWGKVALALVTILSGIWRYLDDRQKEEIGRKLAESEAGKRAEEYIQKARMVRDAINAIGPDGMRSHDSFERP